MTIAIGHRDRCILMRRLSILLFTLRLRPVLSHSGDSKFTNLQILRRRGTTWRLEIIIRVEIDRR